MPELPEVETIKNQLLEQILNKKIIGAEVIKPRMINVSVADFKKKIEGEKIKNIRRRAKMLIMDFSNDYSLIIHLKMTGQLIYGRETGRGTPHIIYTFVDRSQLKHYDARLFGYAKLFKTTEADDFIEERDLGPEILEKEFTLLKFEELLKQRKKVKLNHCSWIRVLSPEWAIFTHRRLVFAQKFPPKDELRRWKSLKLKEFTIV